MKGDEIKVGDILEDSRYSRERLFHLGHDYKSPRVRSKYIKQLKAILWVGRFYMIRMAHDGTTINFFRFPGSPELLPILGSLSSKSKPLLKILPDI